MRNVQYYCKETDSTVTVCVVLLSGQLGKNIDVNIITAGGTAIGRLHAYAAYKASTILAFRAPYCMRMSIYI